MSDMTPKSQSTTLSISTGLGGRTGLVRVPRAYIGIYGLK